MNMAYQTRIREEKCAFVQDAGTRNSIFKAVEGSNRNEKDLQLCFIDYAKAFGIGNIR